MLVSMKEMLEDARKHHYALPAFDVSNYDMMRAVLEACEEERSPALLMALGVDLQGRDMNLLASMIRSASNYFNIPVCLHLDHATDFNLVKRAIDDSTTTAIKFHSSCPFTIQHPFHTFSNFISNADNLVVFKFTFE